MRKRIRNKAKDRRIFARTEMKTKKLNVIAPQVYRGGIRL